MARIAGVDLPREKRIEVGIRSIYGIGPARSKQILEATGINPDTRVKDLTDDEVNLLRDYIDKISRLRVISAVRYRSISRGLSK